MSFTSTIQYEALDAQGKTIDRGEAEGRAVRIGFQAPMKDLSTFGARYAEAWSSQDSARLASFYAEDGSLTVNAGPPSVGRAAITATAQAYMAAFPDMVVKMTEMREERGRPVFHWLWTGTNTGPGGTGKSVRITGYEEWTLDANGLIAESKGHFDEAEYQRQLQVGAPP